MLRQACLVGIVVTGLVHWVALWPLLDLHGASYVADLLLHVVVPALVVLTWLGVGPRGRIHSGDVARSLLWPVVWLAYTLVHGAVSGWYPYPFLDVREHGYPAVALGLRRRRRGLPGRLVGGAVGGPTSGARRRGASGTTPRRPIDRT